MLSLAIRKREEEAMKKQFLNILALGLVLALPIHAAADNWCAERKALDIMDGELKNLDDTISKLTNRIMQSHDEVTDLGKALAKARACGAPQSKIDTLTRHLRTAQEFLYMEQTDFRNYRLKRATLANLIKRLKSVKTIAEIRAIQAELGNVFRCGAEFTAKECLAGFAIWEAYKLLELSVEYNSTVFELCRDPDTQWSEDDLRGIGGEGFVEYMRYLCEFYQGDHGMVPAVEIGGSYFPEIGSNIWPEKPGVYRCDGQVVVYESFGGSICRRCY